MRQGSLYFEDDKPAQPPRRRFLTVTELLARLRGVFEDQFSNLFIAGEISGTKTSPNGHIYFTLKDPGAELSCVVYKSSLRYLRFKPKDGIAVIARGRLDAWRSGFQLIVESLEPQGHGALQFAFEELKRKLTAEGLFAADRKRPLKALPARIGIVTSPTGAVIQDMLRIFERRFPGLHIRVYPALVQGEGSIEQVCAGLDYFSRSGWADVVIVARGGGSLEDLWTFNEEAVARAIANCAVPVISAIGHETDVTIADFVADLRAPTPSAAAELAILPKSQWLERIAIAQHKVVQSARYEFAMLERRLRRIGTERPLILLRRRIGGATQKIDEADYRMRELLRSSIDTRRRRLQTLTKAVEQRDVRLRFGELHRRLERLDGRLRQSIERRLARAHARLDPVTAHLTQLSPLKILDRGYALVHRADGTLVKDPAEAPAGTDLNIRLAAGKVDARVI